MFVLRHSTHTIGAHVLGRLAGLALTAMLAQTAIGSEARSGLDRRDYDGWATYGGSSENIKYSALTQITPQNVGSLHVAWTYSSGEASQTNKTDMKTNPIVVNGVLYGLNPQLRLFALDAASGGEKWVYDPLHVPLKGKNVGRGDFASSTKISRGVAIF